MSEVSYSNVPPMMAAIKSGDIEAIRSLLHAGHSPNEPQCYQVMIGDWPRDDEAFPLELAVLEIVWISLQTFKDITFFVFNLDIITDRCQVCLTSRPYGF